MKSFVVAIFLLCATLPGVAQTYEAINTFLNTPFFDEFLALREEAERSVREFKLIQDRYSPEEIARLRDYYNASAKYFNLVLVNIKADMLERKKARYIIDYPESYAKQVETDLRRAREYYQDTYQKELIQLTQGELTGSALLAMLPSLLQYGQTAFSLLKRIQSEIRKFNETMLDKHFIEPYRFHEWDEIQ